MEQHYIDEKTGIGYTLQDDYFYQTLPYPPKKTAPRDMGTAAFTFSEKVSQDYIS